MHDVTEIEPIPYVEGRDRDLDREIEDATHPPTWWERFLRWLSDS